MVHVCCFKRHDDEKTTLERHSPRMLGCTSVRSRGHVREKQRSSRRYDSTVGDLMSGNSCTVTVFHLSPTVDAGWVQDASCQNFHSLRGSRLMSPRPHEQPALNRHNIKTTLLRHNKWISRRGSLGRRGHMRFVPNKRLQSPDSTRTAAHAFHVMTFARILALSHSRNRISPSAVIRSTMTAR